MKTIITLTDDQRLIVRMYIARMELRRPITVTNEEIENMMKSEIRDIIRIFDRKIDESYKTGE